MSCLVQMEPKGQVYRVNRISLRTDPCGTPKDSATGDDIAFPTQTFWVLPVRYNRIRSRAVSLIPKDTSSLQSNKQ